MYGVWYHVLSSTIHAITVFSLDRSEPRWEVTQSVARIGTLYNRRLSMESVVAGAGAGTGTGTLIKP